MYDAEKRYALGLPVDLTNAHPRLIQATGVNAGKLKTENEFLKEVGLAEEIEEVDDSGKVKKDDIGGVKLLRKKLEDYYRTVRYDVITQRTGDIIKKASAFLSSLNTNYEFNKSNNGGLIYFHTQEDLKDFMIEAGKVIQSEIDTIKSSHPFSENLKKSNLKEILPEQPEDSPVLNNIIHSQPLSHDGIFPIEGIDVEFRKYIFQLFSENIFGASKELMNSKKDKLYKKIKEIFKKKWVCPKECFLKKNLNSNRVSMNFLINCAMIKTEWKADSMILAEIYICFLIF